MSARGSSRRVVAANRKDAAPVWRSEPIKGARSLSPAYGPTLVVVADTAHTAGTGDGE